MTAADGPSAAPPPGTAAAGAAPAAPAAPAFEVRDVEALEHFHQIEEVQREAWGFADKEIVPQSVLLAIRNAGGLVLGAFEPGGRLDGFAFSFLAERGGERFHHSHMAAVRPGCKGSGMAFALKQAQRSRVLELGIDLVTWTYDPIEARNGAFNVRKLGVTAHRYLDDIYGLSSGFIHGGMATDRVAVRWELRSPRAVERAEAGLAPTAPPPDGVPCANETRRDEAGRRVPVAWAWDSVEERVLVEIPSDIQALKREARLSAKAWRLHIREGLGRLLGEGYRIDDFHARDGDPGEGRRPFYLLRRAG